MPTVLEAPLAEVDSLLDEGDDSCCAPVSLPIDSQAALRTDTLADSVLVLLILAVVQRAVGFVRGVVVCRWLSPEELGQWDMAFGFLTLAAPLAVLGLPGSFGRYLEYFRQRGQLRTLVRRTAIACTALTLLALFTVLAARPWFSQLIFGRPEQTQLVLALAVCLVAVVAYNYLTELLTALRMARVASVVQFFNSLLFAGLSLLFLFAWQTQAAALVAAYGGACLVLIVAMLWFLRNRWRELPPETRSDAAPHATGFWSRLLPFAAWVWVTNLLYNLFEVVDRYMIVHYSTDADPLALVGYYHSSRIVPLLLISVASLLSTIMLPHLSHDWEAGRRAQVSARLNFALKLLGLMLFAGSVAILLAAPLLFNVAFGGKYSGGLAVLPWTLTYCCWLGLMTMAQTYLWCAERARLSCLAIGVGLLANIGLNALLLPRMGLPGAVLATAAANALVLAMIYGFNRWHGMEVSRAVWFVSLLPLAIGIGTLPAVVALMVVFGIIIGTDKILDRSEKQQLLTLYRDYRNRISRTG